MTEIKGEQPTTVTVEPQPVDNVTVEVQDPSGQVTLGVEQTPAIDINVQEASPILVEIVDGRDGKSAYQIAVEEGFGGTVAEWLISLSQSASYVHEQVYASPTWTIQHSLGFLPTPTVVDNEGSVILGWHPAWSSDTILVLSFDKPRSGTCIVS